MGNFGTGGWLVIGIILVVLGWLLKSNIFELLLDIAGWILIIIGIIAVVMGLINMITGGRRRSSGF
jgi:sulfite exporter TauE/SafE